MKDYPDVDAFLADRNAWKDEIIALREILLASSLEESVKWGKPCYGADGNNLAIVQPFKHFVALLFVKGALLDDPEGLLQEQGKNTRSAKRLCFEKEGEVRAARKSIEHFVTEAIAAEKEGRTLPEPPPLQLVSELQERLDGDAALHAAFTALTPGRQRAYNLYFSDAKRSTTRASRVEKHVERILAGKGLRDR